MAKVAAPDFSSLDDFDLDALSRKGKPAAVADGQIARAPRHKFRPDPNQPRKAFRNLESLAESIKAEGVKQPLVVGSPDAAGVMTIKDGERRWRASELAALDQLPYVIDDAFDKLTQLIVNMQREDNTPDEKAATILELEDRGVKRVEIARRMGKSPAFVTELADFAKLSPELRVLYDAGRCTDVTVLNLLRRTQDKYPDEVATFIADDTAEINRRTVTALAERLKRPAQAQPPVEPQVPPADEGSTESPAGAQSLAGQQVDDADDGADDDLDVDPAEQKPHPEVSDRFKRPVVRVTLSGKPAVLLVNRRCEPGQAWVRFEDGSEKEVRFASVRNVEITDG